MEQWVPSRRDVYNNLIASCIIGLVTGGVSLVQGVPPWVALLVFLGAGAMAMVGGAAYLYVRTNLTRPRDDNALKRLLLVWLTDHSSAVRVRPEFSAPYTFTIESTDRQDRTVLVRKHRDKASIRMEGNWEFGQATVDSLRKLRNDNRLAYGRCVSAIKLEIARTGWLYQIQYAGEMDDSVLHRVHVERDIPVSPGLIEQSFLDYYDQGRTLLVRIVEVIKLYAGGLLETDAPPPEPPLPEPPGDIQGALMPLVPDEVAGEGDGAVREFSRE